MVAEQFGLKICPACGSHAYVAGVKYSEVILDEVDEDSPDEEIVELRFVAEEFICFVCDLHLNSRGEVESAQIDLDSFERETRQREYEPDCGND